MPTMSDILREAGGQADATAQLLKGLALQPVAGLGGGSRVLMDLLRGRGVDASMEAGAKTVEDISGWGGPVTDRGAQRLNELGSTIERGTQAVGDALGNPIDKLGEVSPAMGAAALGLVETVDPTKGAGRAAKAAGRATKAAKEAAKPVNPALKGFGEAKQAREAATAARLVKQAEAAPVERQKGAGTRAKVEPDVYRQQFKAAATPEEGTASVLAAALRGEHLKPQAGGGWVGMPRTVQTGPQLGAMRKSIDSQFMRGVEALNFADRDRMGTWYDRAKAAHAEINEPWQLDRGLEGTAAYSAGVAPESELAFNLKHQNSRALGEQGMAYRGAPMRTLDKAVAGNTQAPLAHKVGEYRAKNDPRVIENSPFGVNDFRMAQTFGYTDPQGNPWKAGVSDTMHPVMDAETAMAVGRANARKAGGRDDWTGSTLQEIPWVLNKAEDIYGRGKKGRFAGGEEGMVAALREANNTTADYLPKHALSATYEYTPGADVGHVPQVLDMPLEGKREYGKPGAWATEGPMQQMDFDSPYGNIPAGSVGAGERDALYRAAGLRQQPTTEALGQYQNRLGGIENSPVGMAHPLMDFQTVGEGGATQAATINPSTMKAVEAIEGMRGTLDAQEASAANLPVTLGSRQGKSSVLMERDSPPTAQELRAMTTMAGQLRDADVARLTKRQDKVGGPLPESQMRTVDPYIGVTPTKRGALVLNKGGRPLSAKERAALAEGMPGATPRAADYEGTYLQAMTPASEAGQGIATSRMLQRFAEAPPELARNLSESEEVRALIRQKMDRDEAMGGARPDIQKMRNFMAEGDWAKAVEMMRKGTKPAAALAALGYSLQGMAAEAEEQP